MYICKTGSGTSKTFALYDEKQIHTCFGFQAIARRKIIGFELARRLSEPKK
jgi:hypothetical protein